MKTATWAGWLVSARPGTSTSLALSKATITYGHETAEKLTVTISSPVPGTSNGKVTVMVAGPPSV
jgi:hypothetical protein